MRRHRNVVAFPRGPRAVSPATPELSLPEVVRGRTIPYFVGAAAFEARHDSARFLTRIRGLFHSDADARAVVTAIARATATEALDDPRRRGLRLGLIASVVELLDHEKIQSFRAGLEKVWSDEARWLQEDAQDLERATAAMERREAGAGTLLRPGGRPAGVAAAIGTMRRLRVSWLGDAAFIRARVVTPRSKRGRPSKPLSRDGAIRLLRSCGLKYEEARSLVDVVLERLRARAIAQELHG